jgi:hypothetical protein
MIQKGQALKPTIPARFRITQARVLCFPIYVLSLLIFFPVALRAGLLSKDEMEELKARLLSGSVSEVTAVISGIEGAARSGSESEKMTSINQSIELATAIFSTVDRTVPLPGTVLRTPNLESLGPQGKRIFAGSDPEAIEDPALRAAYKKLIQENNELMVKVGVEREKYDAAGYTLKAASRIIETSSDRPKLLKSVLIHIEAMSAAPWAKERILSELIPDYVAKASPELPPVNNSPKKSTELIAERPIEQSLSKISHQPPTGEQAPALAVTNQYSKVALEPRLIWPWIAVCAALMIVAWGIFKRRS